MTIVIRRIVHFDSTNLGSVESKIVRQRIKYSLIKFKKDENIIKVNFFKPWKIYNQLMDNITNNCPQGVILIMTRAL
jgi:hypothetical protein